MAFAFFKSLNLGQMPLKKFALIIIKRRICCIYNLRCKANLIIIIYGSPSVINFLNSLYRTT